MTGKPLDLQYFKLNLSKSDRWRLGTDVFAFEAIKEDGELIAVHSFSKDRKESKPILVFSIESAEKMKINILKKWSRL